MNESLKPWLYGGVIGCVVLAFFFDVATEWLILAMVVYIIVLAIGFGVYECVTVNKLQTQLPDALKYDSEEGIIILNSRDKSHAKRFSIENYEGQKLGYEEEKLIFTSVTVGGVTTGGVDKTGGYQTEKIKTDRYNLFFEYIDPMDHVAKKFCVREIVLSDDLIPEAEASHIRGYVEDDRIIVVKPVIYSDRELSAYGKLQEMNGGGFATHMSNILESDRIRSMPSKEKCRQILDWICAK